VLDSSKDGEPLTYLEGGGQIIGGLERELRNLKAGDKKSVMVKAEDGYGKRNEKLAVSMPLSKFSSGLAPEVGDQFRISETPERSGVYTVTRVNGEEVFLDGNHPLAGQALFFDVQINSIRDATDEEVKHGHAHKKGSHHH